MRLFTDVHETNKNQPLIDFSEIRVVPDKIVPLDVFYSELDPLPGWPSKIQDQFLMCGR